jgi:ATP-dependent RNA helicase DDX55/SPB4
VVAGLSQANRELAIQVHKVIEALLSAQPEDGPSLSPPLLLIGGSRTVKEDAAEYLERGASILVGTPGRLEEFLLGSSSLASDTKKKSIPVVAQTKQLEVVILDEADRLLDLGFSTCLTRLLLSFPKQRRTGLFSATMTDALNEIVRIGLRNPVKVVVKVEAQRNVESRTPAALHNFFVVCKAQEKLWKLWQLLETESQGAQAAKFIVYFSTCAAVDYFYKVRLGFAIS